MLQFVEFFCALLQQWDWFWKCCDVRWWRKKFSRPTSTRERRKASAATVSSAEQSFFVLSANGMVASFLSWLEGKIHPDGSHPSLGRTRDRSVRRGTLPCIWPLSSKYEDIRPMMPFWHQLFDPKLGDSWRAGVSYSFPYRSKRPAHCPQRTRGQISKWTGEPQEG